LGYKAGVEYKGLSLDRWVFWRALFRDMSRSKDKKLSSNGRAGYCQIIVIGNQSGLKIPGEA
jgi:hypothetical protein